MKALVASSAAGTLGALLVLLALRRPPAALRRPPHLRPNYRGRAVLGTAGVVLVLPLQAGAGVSLLLRSGQSVRATLAIALAGTSMAVLGIVDDVYGDRRAGGLLGHARAALKGRPTTGALKAAGGAAVGLAAAWVAGRRGAWIVVGGAIVALAAHLTNLLDLRPGRAIKAWLPPASALIAVGAPDGVAPPLVALAVAAAVFIAYELREKVMLGDTGAGLLGAALGAGLTASVDQTGLLVCLGVLAALTLVSEVTSFSLLIDAVPPLRVLDRLGRRPD